MNYLLALAQLAVDQVGDFVPFIIVGGGLFTASLALALTMRYGSQMRWQS